MYQPPFQITSEILKRIASISSKLGEIDAVHLDRPSPELRKQNRIKTIQSSLAIEGNTLSEEQISAILEGRRVLGPEKDILEVQNTIRVYDQLASFDPYNESAFLKAHQMLMLGLIDSAGKYRSASVGILKVEVVAHLAPPAARVPILMDDLFGYISQSEDLLLIKSCVFHYELEFIHPFLDGNGRMGRLWQSLLLISEFPVFEFVPLETIIKKRQADYYDALSKSDKAGESTPFILFMLDVIDESLKELLQNQPPTLTGIDRLMRYRPIIKDDLFSRKDYMRFYKEISSATASRDLKEGVDRNILSKLGDKRTTQYRFKDV